MGVKAAFYTLGCKLNFAETNAIGEEFLRRGFEIVNFKDKADVYVINTCTVTENAERECRQIVRRALRNNPQAFVAVTGCYAQLRPEEIAKIDGVDAVLGNNEKFELFSLFPTFNKNQLSCISVSPYEQIDSFHSAVAFEANQRTRAFFKIQDGCDYKCSFCTIPKARGKSRSLSPHKVIEQFKNLISAGYKEIVLTGVNVGDYGKAFRVSLYDILLKMIEVEGDFRVRISSIEPNLLSDEIISLSAQTGKLCDHFHIPLQSGSNNILKLMQRRYTAEFYEDLIYKIKDAIPAAGIGVDVIVGTPGETEKDFSITYKLLEKLPVSYLHVFTYSERPGTKALELGNSVPVKIRKERNKILRELSAKKRLAFYNSMKKKELQVLFENNDEEGFIKGFTSNYIRIKHPFISDLVNNFANVQITKANEFACEAEISNQLVAIDE